MKRMVSVFCTAGVLLYFLVGIAFAAYPDRPVSVICGSSPGGSTDVIARMFANTAEKYLGEPMVVVNKPGGGGTLGPMFVKNAKPDGYNILISTASSNAIMAASHADGKVHPFSWDDYQALGIVNSSPLMLCVLYDSPWKTVSELVADMKARPDFFKFCSAPNFTGSHLGMEMFLAETGTKARHVAYKGGGPCIQAALGGHFNLMTQFASTTKSLVSGKKLRWLATTAKKRLKQAPDVPTMTELGLNVVFEQWTAFFVHKDTPKPIVEKLRDVVSKVAHDKNFVATMEKTGQDVNYMNASDMMAHINAELAKNTKLIKELKKKMK